MLSYNEYRKTKVKIELSLSEWDFLTHMLRIHAKTLGEQLKYKEAVPFMDIADKIDDVCDIIKYGGNN